MLSPSVQSCEEVLKVIWDFFTLGLLCQDFQALVTEKCICTEIIHNHKAILKPQKTNEFFRTTATLTFDTTANLQTWDPGSVAALHPLTFQVNEDLIRNENAGTEQKQRKLVTGKQEGERQPRLC